MDIARPGKAQINVSNGLGSFTQMTETEWKRYGRVAHSPSKAALTMVTIQYANAIPGIRFNAVDPGYTATDLNGRAGTQTVEQGPDAVVQLATLGTHTPTGTFTDRNGTIPRRACPGGRACSLGVSVSKVEVGATVDAALNEVQDADGVAGSGDHSTVPGSTALSSPGR